MPASASKRLRGRNDGGPDPSLRAVCLAVMAYTVTGDILARALAAEKRLSEAEKVLGAVLDHCGARRTYHALKYSEAVEAAEAFLTEEPDNG